jgi:hypothetical protein
MKIKLNRIKNMFKMKTTVFVFAAMMALPVFAQEAGIPIFQDNFDTYATFAENWKPEGSNIKPENGHLLFDKGGAMWMKRDTPLEFCAEMDVTMDMTHKQDKSTWGSANCGFRIEDFNFYVLTNGNSWVIYRLPGWTRSEGIQIKIDGFELGKPFKLTLIRKVDKGNATYVFRGNGKDIGRFVCEAPKPDANGIYKPLIFISNGVTMTMDNFTLSTVKDSADASPNVVINSSFEHAQEGFPLFYCRMPSSMSLFASLGTTPYEEYTGLWQLDTSEKHSGNQSLKMITNNLVGGQALFAHGAGWVKDKPGVFSVWMKADKENFPVTITYGISKEVLVGTEWKRYEVVNPKMFGTGPYSPVRIQFQKVKGALWVDDLQAEFLDVIDEAKLKAGVPFATPYKVSSLDKEKFGVRKVEKPVRAPEFTIPKLAAGVTPTIDLDAWKNKAAKLDTFYYNNGKTPTNRTEVYLACDNENLYLGYRCFVKEFPKDTIKKENRDGFGLFARDSVEMFLDPAANGKYYQLATDAAGNQVDISVTGGSAWNGDWKTESNLNSALKSVDYLVTVPFANFTDANLKSRWQVNICRNDISTGWQQTSIAEKGFKDTAYWAFANLPEDVVKPYVLGITEGSYSDTKDGSSISVLSRLNYYMNEPEAVFKVETTLPDSGKMTAVLNVAGKIVKKQASANFKITLPLKGIPDGTHDATLSLQKDGKTVSSVNTSLIKRSYKAGATQINHFSRSLIHDGKPIVPYSPFFEPGRNTVKTMTGIIDYFYGNGYRFCHILFDQRAKDKDTVEIMKYANEKGVKLVLWAAFDQLPENKWDEYQKMLDFPCVTSLMVLDEPEIRGLKSEDAKAHLDAMRARTPYLPVHMNNTSIGIPVRYADLHTDILGLDDYLTNSENRTVESVVNNADIMWKAGKENAKPCMFFLVGGNFPLHYREPSYAEQIAQTYGVLAAGCVSFSYFYGIVQTEANWKAMKQLNQEILSLTAVICSEEDIGELSCSAVNTADAKLRHRTKKYQGYVYVISVNTGKNPMDNVTFTLPAEYKYDGSAEVLFENRKLDVKDGKFTDEFPGHSRHVYRVKIK